MLGAGVAGERRRHAGGESFEQRGLDEKLLDRRRGPLQDLVREVMKDVRLAARRGDRPGERPVLEAFQHQHQRRGPAVGIVVDLLNDVRRQRLFIALEVNDAGGLFLGQADVLPTDAGEAVRGLQAAERHGRVGAARHEDRDAPRRFLRRHADHLVQRALGADFLVVVQHERAPPARAAEQPPEVVARVDLQARLILDGEQRQLDPAVQPLGGRGQIVEERRRVAIARVDLVPDMLFPFVREVTAHQRGLAGAGRRGHPYQRPRARPLQRAKQTHARVDALEPRAIELGGPQGSSGRSFVRHGGTSPSAVGGFVARPLALSYPRHLTKIAARCLPNIKVPSSAMLNATPPVGCLRRWRIFRE